MESARDEGVLCVIQMRVERSVGCGCGDNGGVAWDLGSGRELLRERGDDRCGCYGLELKEECDLFIILVLGVLE